MNETSPLVRCCLEMDSRSLRWNCELNPTEAFNFLAASKEYNEMKNLTGMVEKINKIIPKMQYGGENPNNGKTFHTFTVGNECSRVIYINIIKYYLKSRFTDSDITNLITKIQGLGRNAGADEISVDETDTKATIRLWWD